MTYKRFCVHILLIIRKIKKLKDGPDDILTEKQQIGLKIFKTGLNDDNNFRFLNIDDGSLYKKTHRNQISTKKYIVSKDFFMNQDVDTFITFDNNNLTIVNHNWSYDIDFPIKTVSKMNLLFEKAVMRDREKMENSINKNVTLSLTLILKDFQKRQQANAILIKK